MLYLFSKPNGDVDTKLQPLRQIHAVFDDGVDYPLGHPMPADQANQVIAVLKRGEAGDRMFDHIVDIGIKRGHK